MIIAVMQNDFNLTISFARIVLDNGTVSENDIFQDPSLFFNRQVSDLKLIDKDNIICLILGKQYMASTQYSIFLTTISFVTKTITYKYTVYLPSLAQIQKFNVGKFVNKANFLYSGSDKILSVDNTGINSWVYELGIIISNFDHSRTCAMTNDDFINPIPPIIQTLNQQTNAFNLTVNQTVFSITIGYFPPSRYTANFSSLILSDQSQGIFCLRENPTQYNISVPQTSTFYSFTEGYAHLIDITPFTATIVCGSTPAVFTYSGVTADMYGTPLPSFITIESSTGTIQISASSVAGTNVIKIIGELSNEQKKSQTYTLDITPKSAVTSTNQPPCFVSDLESVTISLNSVQTYQLPQITDLENDAVKLTTYKYGVTYLPMFITFNSSKNIYTFKPKNFADVGTTLIRVKLADSKSYNLFGFNVIVTNTAPNFTTTVPESLELPINTDNIFNFSDAEQNPITVKCSDESNLGTPYYIIVNSNSINIKSTQYSEIYKAHRIQISLTDGQLTSQTNFDLKFITLAPIFDTPLLQNNTITLNDTQVYQLPTFSQRQGNAVSLDLQQAPSFITLKGTALYINPNEEIMPGQYTLVLLLSDSDNNTSTYIMTISVVSSQPVPPPPTPPPGPPTPPSSPPDPPTPPTPLPDPPTPPPDPPTPPTTPPDTPTTPPTTPPDTPPTNPPDPPTPPPPPSIPPTTPPLSPPPIQPPSIPQTNDVNSNVSKVNIHPRFSRPLEPLIIKADSILNYTLPNIIDLDNETVVTLELADCIPFATFEQNTTICFKPQKYNAREAPYKIKIRLCDRNLKSKREYVLNIYIQQSEQDTYNQSLNTSYQSNSQGNNTNDNLLPKNATVELKVKEISRTGQIDIQISAQNQSLSQYIIDNLRDDQLIGQIETENRVFQAQIKIHERRKDEGIVVGQLIFDTYRHPSSGNEMDKMQLIFTEKIQSLKLLNIQLRINKNVTTIIPQQYSLSNIKLLEFIEDAAFYISTIILPASLLLSIFMPFILQHILTTLIDLQFLMMLCLVSINVPGIVQDYQKKILDFTFLDIFYTNLWLTPTLQEGDRSPLNEFFLIRGYNSNLVIYNLGSSFIYLGIIVLSVVSIIVIKILGSSSILVKCKNHSQWWYPTIVNFTSRLLIQFYTPIILAAAMNLNQFNSDLSAFTKINSILGLMIMGFIHFCIGAIFWSMSFLQFKEKLDKIYQCFSPLIERQNLRKGIISRFWMLIAITRWFLAICILIFLKDSYLLQILSLQTISFVIVAIIVHSKPYSEQSDFRFQIFIEVMAQVYLYALLCLSEFQPLDTQTRLDIGDFLLAIVTLVFLLSVFRVLIRIGAQCRRLWISRKRKDRKRKAVEIEQKKASNQMDSQTFKAHLKKKEDGTPRFQENTIAVQPLVLEEARDAAVSNNLSILDQTRCIEEKVRQQDLCEISDEEEKEIEATQPPIVGWLQKNELLPPQSMNKANEFEQVHLELPPINAGAHQQSLHTFRVNTSLVTISERDMPQRASRANIHRLDESSESRKDSIDFQQ